MDGQTGRGFGASRFGYMTIAVEADGAWRGAVIDPTAVKPEPTVIAECDSTKPSQRLPVCWEP